MPDFMIPDEVQVDRRLKILRITDQFLLELLKHESPMTLSFHGIPPDAKVHCLSIDNSLGYICMTIESETFPPASVAPALEQISVNVTRHYPTE